MLLLACCAFFFLWKLAAFGLIGADEPRYAQIAREMLEHHDWITPTLSGIPWLEKPPLFYWQAMLAYRIFGVSDWAARLPSVIDASALALSVYLFLRRLRPAISLDAGLVLVSSAGIVGFARAASTDMPLAAMFSIAMLCWWAWFEEGGQVFIVGFYGFLALAMLAKGPVAPFLAAALIVLFAASQRSGQILQKTLWLPGILIFLAVGLPWFVLVQLRNPQFFRVFILEHNLARFGSNMFHHPEPFWYYVPVILLGWLPWTVFVIAAVIWAVRRMRKAEADQLSVFLLIWVGLVLALFSISQSKLPGYILPAIPPGVLLLATYLGAKPARPPALLGIAHACISAGLIFAALLFRYTLLQRHFSWNPAATPPLIAACIWGALVFLLTFKSGFRGLRLGTLVTAVMTVAIALHFGSIPLNDQLSERSVSEALARVSPRSLPVAAVLVSREVEFGLQFYRNQSIPRYELKQAPAGEHLVVAREGFRKAFARDVPGRKIVQLGSFPEQKLEFFYVSAQ